MTHTYRQWPLLSYTAISYFLDSPEKFRLWAIGKYKPKETDPMRLGTALHADMMGFRTFSNTVARQPNKTTKEGKAQAAEMEAEGLYLLTGSYHDTYAEITADYRNLTPLVNMMRMAETWCERPTHIALTDSDGGEWLLKGMFDSFATISGTLLDIKCTGKDTRSFDYHVRDRVSLQLALYREGLRQMGQNVSQVLVVKVVTTAPYLHEVIELTRPTLDNGLWEVQKALANIRRHVNEYGMDSYWPATHDTYGLTRTI